MESETSLEHLANCCHVDGSFGMTIRFLAAEITEQELSMRRLPAPTIGFWASLACGDILAGMVTNSLELA